VLLYDFCYYWLHRAGHEVNLLWAAHVVHHQSEFYNLGTALRQTSSGVLLGWLFYLPMAVIGVPIEVFAAAALIDLLYQFWIHTELIGSLGWFDRWFASPSNHRVHHAVNLRYLDRNYGGILIIWDRLFKSFEPEDTSEPCVYGTRAPLRSFNPVWANLEVYAALLRDSWRASTWRERLLLWFGPPGWQSSEMATRFPRRPFDIQRARHLPPLSAGDVLYGLVQFALLLGVAVDFLGAEPHIGVWAALGYCAYLAASLVSLTAWFDAHRLARQLETLRVAGTALAVVSLNAWFGRAHLEPMVIALVTLLSTASLVALWVSQRATAAGTAIDSPVT
jgi:alkylglycerol monooxygenase